jgi:DNA invertase Pin-like site-specific DNA recombinase
MKRAVLYARVSTDAQQKEGTIESQVLELKRQSDRPYGAEILSE